jgi:hypothetical protein
MSTLTGTNETPGSSGPGGPGTDDAKLAAAGKVTSAGEGKVVFAPAGTNYELHLLCPRYAGPLSKPVRGTIRVTARKLWTVPSGGNWIQPIFGPPRIIQGRVRALAATHLIVQAGAPIRVDLPDDDIVFDLANGPISVGVIVNVTALPGASFESQ